MYIYFIESLLHCEKVCRYIKIQKNIIKLKNRCNQKNPTKANKACADVIIIFITFLWCKWKF